MSELFRPRTWVRRKDGDQIFWVVSSTCYGAELVPCCEKMSACGSFHWLEVKKRGAPVAKVDAEITILDDINAWKALPVRVRSAYSVLREHGGAAREARNSVMVREVAAMVLDEELTLMESAGFRWLDTLTPWAEQAIR